MSTPCLAPQGTTLLQPRVEFCLSPQGAAATGVAGVATNFQVRVAGVATLFDVRVATVSTQFEVRV